MSDMNEPTYQSALEQQQRDGMPTLVVLDGDLYSAFSYNDARPSSPIAEILATIEGANDEASWHWLALLESGAFAYITGGCDYTGWDCRSSLEVYEAPTLDECLRLIPEAERGDLRGQLPHA